MCQENVVLCAASAYEQKFYLNEDFADLPEGITEEDILYDEIGSGLKIKQLQRERAELFESLEMYYRVFFLGDTTGLE